MSDEPEDYGFGRARPLVEGAAIRYDTAVLVGGTPERARTWLSVWRARIRSAWLELRGHDGL